MPYRFSITFFTFLISSTYILAGSFNNSHNRLACDLVKQQRKFKSDTCSISPEQANRYIGKLVKVLAKIHHVNRYKNKVVLHINTYPPTEAKPVVIIKPMDKTRPLMTITLTEGGLKRFNNFETSIVVVTGVLKLKNGLPNINIKDDQNIEMHVAVE